jgi:16S rRNA (guanine527-N7)-methyltransferase
VTESAAHETPPVPGTARGVFATRLPLAERYAGLLATDATVRGLIGPREVGRLWERHLLNCAVLTELLPEGASVADVGTGAGLPGIVLAIRRPDLTVTLVEPLLRRTSFLEEVVEALDLTNAVVRRARAEELHGQVEFDAITSRAVAPLERLASWCLPLTRAGGWTLAMKGSAALAELATAEPTLVRAGATWSIATLGADLLDTPVTVVRIRKSGGGPG